MDLTQWIFDREEAFRGDVPESLPLPAHARIGGSLGFSMYFNNGL